MRKPDDYLALSRHERQRLRLASKPRKYAKNRRKKFSRDELLEYLRVNRFRSWRILMASRLDGDPTVYDFRKEFGNWKGAIESAFGRDIVEVKELDHRYVMMTILEFNLWTLARYVSKHNLEPSILPSRYQLLKEWGRWSNVVACARRYSIAVVTGDYLRLWRRLGKCPTLEDCRQQSLDLSKAVDYFGGKKELDEMVRAMMGASK